MLCHKTLDTVAAIHFCMVIRRHTSYSGRQETSLFSFSIFNPLLRELSSTDVHLASFCQTLEGHTHLYLYGA